MTLINRLLGRTAKAQPPRDGLFNSILGAIGERQRYLWPDLSKIENQIQAYRSNPALYSTINKIVTTAKGIEFEVLQVVGEEEQEVEDHPIERLLDKPNLFTSRGEFLGQLLTYYLITGNAYLYKMSGADGLPAQLYILRPDRMRVVAGDSTERPVAGYMYRIFGRDFAIPPERVIHLKMSDPGDDYYGLSPIYTLWLTVQTDQAMARWNFGFFGKNNAVPSAVVSFPPTMTNTDYERSKREWAETYGGEERATAFIRGDKITVQNLSQSHEDMNFLDGRVFNRELIERVYGLSGGLLDKNATMANSDTAHSSFLDDVVYPLMNAVAEKFTAELAPLYGDNLCIEAEDIRGTNKADERAEIVVAKEFLTVNEIRQKYYSMPTLPNADIPSAIWNTASISAPTPPPDVPATMPPPGLPEPAATPEAPPTEGSDKALTDVESLIVPRVYYTRSIAKQIGQFVKYVGHDKPFDAFRLLDTPKGVDVAVKAWADIHEDLHWVAIADPGWVAKYESRISMSGVVDMLAADKDAAEAKMKESVLAFLNALLERVLKNTRQAASNARKASGIPGTLEDYTNYFDEKFWQDMQDLLNSYLRGEMQDAVLAGAESAAKRLTAKLGLSLDPSVFNTSAAAYALKFTDEVLAGFGTTSQKGVGAILGRWIGSEGATLQDLITAFQESPLFSLKRAELTAITETTRAFSQGEMIAGAEIAKTAGVPFVASKSSIAPPLHPGCRCWIDTVPTYAADDVTLTGFNAMYHTSRDTVVCPVCAPYNGKYVGDGAA